MRIKELGQEGRGHTTALVFDPDEPVIATLEAHARRTGIRAAHFTALGAFRSATLAYFDIQRAEYMEIPVEEQVEVTCLIGDMSIHDDEPVVHAHCVLGRRDGSAITGHLLEARVRPTLELFLTAYDAEIARRIDDATGLPLIR